MERVLVVSEDPAVVDDLVRLAATAGTELDVVPASAAARRRWAGAPLVLVADGCAGAVARLRLPRRAGVVLVGTDLDDAGMWQRAVALGAEHVALLPDAEDWLVARLADAADGGSAEAPLLAVVGGCGGAGASVLSTSLALTAARGGSRALLVDADPLGGGIDLVLGGEHAPGLRWQGLSGTRGRVPGAALASALPVASGVAVLSWDRDAALPVPVDAMAAVLTAGRAAHDLVVVDLPRAADEAAGLAAQLADVVLLVVPAAVRAVAAASRVAAGLLADAADVRLVVRGPGASGLDGPAVADVLGLPLAGVLRSDPGLDLALERGEPPLRRGRGSLGELCALLLDELVPASGRAA